MNKLLTFDYYKRKYNQIILKRFFPNIYLEKIVKRHYKVVTGKKLNLRNPKTVSEKLWWIALYWQSPLIVKCADKYLMREYAKDCGCEEILVPLLGVYNNAEEIDFDALPQKFVLKCNHGCGGHILCEDKSKLDIEATKKQLNNCLSEDYGKRFFEFHYSKIPPKIICEKFLDFSMEKSLIDYKIHCFNGKPAFFLVCTDRDYHDDSVVITSYSLEWEKLSLLKDEGKVDVSKPELLNEMIEYAEKLSKPFPYVRMDFYNVENKKYLGEFTFTPQGNFMTYYKDSTLEMMGDLLKLPKKYKR